MLRILAAVGGWGGLAIVDWVKWHTFVGGIVFVAIIIALFVDVIIATD